MSFKGLINFVTPAVRALWPVTIFDKHKFLRFGKRVYMCNHYSVFDANNLVVQLFKDKLNVIIKAEVFKSNFAKKFLKGIGGIPIERGQIDIKAVKACLKVLNNDEPLLIFPEGTRNKSGTDTMLEFKEGSAAFAIKTKAPVVPMVYYSKVKLFKRTYMLIGDPIDLASCYGKSDNAKSDATAFIREQMIKLQTRLKQIVETPKLLKEYKKREKANKKIYKRLLKCQKSIINCKNYLAAAEKKQLPESKKTALIEKIANKMNLRLKEFDELRGQSALTVN